MKQNVLLPLNEGKCKFVDLIRKYYSLDIMYATYERKNILNVL